jgi:diguanylate cyclase (GGDEF)-like protein
MMYVPAAVLMVSTLTGIARVALWPAVFIAAGTVGFMLGRRKSAPGWQPATFQPSQRVIPDPALRWLSKAHQALGVWAIDGTDQSNIAVARQVNDGVLTAVNAEAIERRLMMLSSDEGEGIEKVEQGTLLFVSRPGAVAAMLLAPGPPAFSDQALVDLRELAGALVYQQMLLPTRESRSPVESLETVGMALAAQLERLTAAPVAVVVNLLGGPQVVAVSPRGDARLLHQAADHESAVASVSRGESGKLFTAYDPIGTRVADRRRSVPAQVIAIGPDTNRLGAVIVWTPQGRELGRQALGDVIEAVGATETALGNARVVHELKQTATIDALTGLKNRRGLEEVMTRMGSERGALVYADLDKFKALNDTLGHPAGDAALVHFASILRDHVRATDTAARIGGEEFAIWLPEATAARGYEVAERIRQSLAERLWLWQSRQWPLTSSFGVAACPETSRSRQNLPALADAALYQAKHAGRNKVVMSGQ